MNSRLVIVFLLIITISSIYFGTEYFSTDTTETELDKRVTGLNKVAKICITAGNEAQDAVRARDSNTPLKVGMKNLDLKYNGDKAMHEYAKQLWVGVYSDNGKKEININFVS